MLNIARQIYTGWSGTTANLPEAEVIPIGDSANERKKIDNFTKRHTTIKEHENVPLPGFTLFKNHKKTWSSGDSTWLVIDPRGFLVRITNDNLDKILHVTGITEGLIQEQCVWAREDSQTKMTLVPISSSNYTDAVKNTELIEGKVSLKDIQIGDQVLLQNGLTGTFLGVQSLYGPLADYSAAGGNRVQTYPRRQIIEVSPVMYHYQTDTKILAVTTKTNTPLTREDAATKINASIQAGGTYFTNTTNMSSGYYSSRDEIRFVSPTTVQKVPMMFDEISKEEAKQVYYNAAMSGDIGRLMLQAADSKMYLIDFPYVASRPVTPSTSFSIVLISTPVTGTEFISMLGSRTYWHRANLKQYSLDDFEKFYVIKKNIKGQHYI